jgi:hypothetical protein
MVPRAITAETRNPYQIPVHTQRDEKVTINHPLEVGGVLSAKMCKCIVYNKTVVLTSHNGLRVWGFSMWKRGLGNGPKSPKHPPFPTGAHCSEIHLFCGKPGYVSERNYLAKRENAFSSRCYNYGTTSTTKSSF